MESGMKTGGRIKNMFKLMRHLQLYYGKLVLGVICGVGQHLSNIAVACIGAYMVGLAVQGNLMEKLHGLMILLLLMICLRVLLSYGESYFNHDVAFHILADFRIKLFQALDRVSPKILLDMRSGQLASVLMSDVEVLEWFFAHTFGSVIVGIVVPIITLAFMGTLCWYLPLIVFPFLVLMAVIPFLMRKKADVQGAVVRETLADANSVAVEGIHGMREILSLNYRQKYKEKNHDYMQRVYKAQWIYGKRLGAEGGLLLVCMGIAMLGVMAAAITVILQGGMERTWYPAVIILAGMTFNPVLEICNMARNFGLILAASNRVFTVLESKSQVNDDGADMNISSIVPDLSFECVTFHYKEDLDAAIKDVSFYIKPGQTVALVGHSGAGKTTCINLLLRYWDTTLGAVKIGGCNVKDMSLTTLHDMTSAVLQDVYLFNTTIRENIRLGRVSATDEEVELAAKAAYAHEFIMEMPQGYDSNAGERGISLSGGQRQRIALARAFLKNAPILILDEAVSNLDSENEKDIQRALKSIYAEKTIVMVAHRLSTIRTADLLLVMRDGKLVQTGTHDELISQDGYYQELLEGQLGENRAL